MNRIHLLIATSLLGATAVVVCGCASSDVSMSNDDMAANSDGAYTGADLGGPSCADVTITAARDIVPVLLKASTHAISSDNATPTWTVLTPDNQLVPLTPTTSNGLDVEYDATLPGTYTFDVTFPSGRPCPGRQIIVLKPPNALSQVYRFRVTPPASTNLSRQDQLITVYGDTPLIGQPLSLQPGGKANGTMTGPSGPIAGEVHLVPDAGPELDVPVGADGKFVLPVDLNMNYHVVMIPTDKTLAPAVIGPLTGVALQVSGTMFTVGAGVAVSGTVKDEAAAVAPGASIALRAGPLPSGLGLTAADGTYSLRAQPGTYSLSVSKAGWPDLTLGSVAVPAGGVVANVALALPRLAMTARVVRSDGVTPVSGATVTIQSRPLANAAVVTVNGSPKSATGIVHATRTTLPDGTVGALPLPAGTYEFFIDPGSLPIDASEGVTGLEVVVAAAGQVSLKLAPRPTLNGQVRSWNGDLVSASVRVRPQAGGAWTRAATMLDGSFSVLTAQGVPLELLVETDQNVALATVQKLFGALGDPLGTIAPTSLTVILPAALPFSGTVLNGASGVAGAAVDILCATCGDPTSLAHADCDLYGNFALKLPNPGLDVDGGTP